jgi:catechol 2,3-dioxygenase-like lactoylglutathione lyase family enzyme
MSEEKAHAVVALKAHLALNVKDVEKSKEFYRKMLGLEPSKVRAGYAKFDVQNPPLNLTLNEAAFTERGALSHLGIQVAKTSDVLATRERWIERGLLTRDEMQTNCCYALQDKTWVQDPDGNQWEVFVVLEDNLTETATCCTTTAGKHENDAAAAPSQTVGRAESAASCETTTAQGAVESSCCSTSSAAAPVGIAR